ncbi:putative transposase/invertase (TIGR01784 family) [Arcicella aurantiaca]|uniref:Putative transposase/invertase (TIGR01784 family) n=1 Tax=Arcicella aurantiaca TaxID=591202 RepID=A0A316E9S1_9BACT|nr:Rpn family recombination-promoting nuclease/putative transposase [Arcicella aurantiaca]PWK27127.1 putative transposase/invertase (TIGR01784 family) [Arcicella aurantiaca]
MNLKEKYVNPFTDFGFKKLFGTEPNKDLLIDFLNQIIPKSHTIKDLSYTSNEYLGYSDVDRKAIFDLFCTSEKGDKFIVELQKAKQNYFKDRSIYYSTFPIQEQAIKGDWNYKLSAVFTVGILDFVFQEDKQEKEVLHIVQLKDQNSEVFYDKLTYLYLEMPNFNKSEDELETHFDKWLYVFKNLNRLEKIPAKLQDKVFKKLFNSAEVAKFTKNEREQYEESLKIYRDWKSITDTAFGEGKIEGKIEVALVAIQNGLSDEMIVTLTGLSSQEINKLRHKPSTK